MALEKNRQIEITIENYGSDGEGVGRAEGIPVFIPGTIRGERVRALIVKTKARLAYGKALEILTPSDRRVTPPCKKAGPCGGCQLQHMSYEEQLFFKTGKVQEALRRIGALEVPVEDCMGMERRLRYRNKVIFPLGGEPGEIRFGFYAPRSHRLIALDDCLLCPERSVAITRDICAFASKAGLAPYDEESRAGTFRRVFLRSGKEGQTMALLSVKEGEFPGLKRALPGVKSLGINYNDTTGGAVLGVKTRFLTGEETIEDEILGCTFAVSPESFFQVNPEGVGKLYRTALDLAQAQGENVYDLYCGVGTISLIAARQARQVTGIEIVKRAVENARENARRNGIENARFYDGPAEKLMPRLMEEGERPGVVILDPPRGGSDERTLRAIAEAQPKRIVYVSCDPATLARDLKFLQRFPFEVKKVQPVDLFPQTSHVETVALLLKKEGL